MLKTAPLTHTVRVRANRPNRDLVLERHPKDHPKRSLRGQKRSAHFRAGSTRHVTAKEARLIKAAAEAAGWLVDLVITEIAGGLRKRRRRRTPAAVAVMDAVTVAIELAPEAVGALRSLLDGGEIRKTMPELILAFQAAGVTVPEGYDKIRSRTTLLDRLGKLLP